MGSSLIPFLQIEKCFKLTQGRPNIKITNLNKKLYLKSLKITYPKWKNLNQLLPFVPPIHHEYYKSVPHENRTAKKKLQARKQDEESNNDIDPSDLIKARIKIN
ncbi:unnamed protein product [Psylliodes chrysocephalus]|uniref:Uncharacterized protein n=1 Tax=Psylliodes chrysocephalus TaxID=3402493 RepID=A0A9P0CLK7_9CUCU|nr:unnamed protein product [Psylliodes chrysocephala]